MSTAKLMKVQVPFAIISLVVLIVGVSSVTMPIVTAQDDASSLRLQNGTENMSEEKETYALIFGHRTIGNIDNSTKLVPSIIGDNLITIEEEFLEDISLAPSQQLEEQITNIVNDGINGSSCRSSLTTQEGENLSVNCISSENQVVWYIHPTS